MQNDLTAAQVSNVTTDDGGYFIQRGSEFVALHFQRWSPSVADSINIMWKGRSTESSIVSPIYLQVYNITSAQWETVDYDNTKLGDTDYILWGSPASAVSNYYDSNNQVSCRIYQQVV